MHPCPCEKVRTPQGLPIDRPWRVACGTPDATGPREHDAASALRRGQDPPGTAIDRPWRVACGTPDATGPREDHAALVLWSGLGLSGLPIDRPWRVACGTPPLMQRAPGRTMQPYSCGEKAQGSRSIVPCVWRESYGVSDASSREDKANRNAGKKGHFSEAPDRPDRLASMRDLAPQMLPWR